MSTEVTDTPHRSPLHDRHVALGAKFAAFGGWEMPLEYAGAGVIKEHTAVRTAVGVFDVSHLGNARVSGPGAAYPGLAEMRHVEQAHVGPDRGVFLDHPAARVLQRHLPAAEGGELRAEGGVLVVKW